MTGWIANLYEIIIQYSIPDLALISTEYKLGSDYQLATGHLDWDDGDFKYFQLTVSLYFLLSVLHLTNQLTSICFTILLGKTQLYLKTRKLGKPLFVNN